MYKGHPPITVIHQRLLPLFTTTSQLHLMVTQDRLSEWAEWRGAKKSKMLYGTL